MASVLSSKHGFLVVRGISFFDKGVTILAIRVESRASPSSGLFRSVVMVEEASSVVVELSRVASSSWSTSLFEATEPEDESQSELDALLEGCRDPPRVKEPDSLEE